MATVPVIAVIGPQDSIETCIKVGKDYKELDLREFPYANEADAESIVKDVAHLHDAILFTGPVPYYQTMHLEEMTHIPSVYVPFNGAGLYRALFEVRDLTDFSRVSIDTIHPEEVEAAYNALQLPRSTQFVLDYENSITADEFINYHRQLYEQGKTDVALTCLKSSFLELQRLGIPTVRIFPVDSVIRETLDRIKIITESIWNKGHHIVVGIISMDQYEDWARDKGIYEVQKLGLVLNQSIFNFVKRIDGHFINSTSGEFVFFTTRKMIEQDTNNFKREPSVQHNVELPSGLSFKIGIGLGGTANLAADHARKALEWAKQTSGGCYIVNEDHELIGPLGGSESVLQLRTTEGKLMEAAEKTGLTPVLLGRVYNAMKNAGSEFTANELAAFLGVTTRSARRLLTTLSEAGLVKVVGKESIHSRGKPRYVYQMRDNPDLT